LDKEARTNPDTKTDVSGEMTRGVACGVLMMNAFDDDDDRCFVVLLFVFVVFPSM
jgi:hypothetical protein